jgi:hypothetical protein
VSRLRCERCGLTYSRAAIARQMALATGVACRRCGGTLEAEAAHEARGKREPVLAVRAPTTGLGRLPPRYDRALSVRESNGRDPE